MQQDAHTTSPRRRGAAMPFGLALALGVLLLQPADARGLAVDTTYGSDELIALTNLDRTSNGLPALAVDDRLVELALERSADMVARDYFSHSIPPDGRTVFDLMEQRDIAYQAAGENLGYNTATGQETALYAQRAFMESPTHRELILSPEFDHVGAASATATDRRIFHTVLFLGLTDELERRSEGENERRSEGENERKRDAVSPSPHLSVSPSPTAGRLRPAGARPLGLVEQLVQRTLRLYLGL